MRLSEKPFPDGRIPSQQLVRTVAETSGLDSCVSFRFSVTSCEHHGVGKALAAPLGPSS